MNSKENAGIGECLSMDAISVVDESKQPILEAEVPSVGEEPYTVEIIAHASVVAFVTVMAKNPAEALRLSEEAVKQGEGEFEIGEGWWENHRLWSINHDPSGEEIWQGEDWTEAGIAMGADADAGEEEEEDEAA